MLGLRLQVPLLWEHPSKVVRLVTRLPMVKAHRETIEN